MGNPMPQNLIKAGCDVTVWNRTKSKCQPLISLGVYANFDYGADLSLFMLASKKCVFKLSLPNSEVDNGNFSFFSAHTNHPLRRLQHLLMSHFPCLQTPTVQSVFSLFKWETVTANGHEFDTVLGKCCC
uniref:Succinic semialdehyde reductase isofom2 n=1 Tax=Solanum tuberosum TaxID=4113 RepID=M1BDA9_SOLTU